MQESPVLIKLVSATVDAATSVFGTRLGALYAYGSGVDGSFIPEFSDLDLAVFCHGRPTLGDCLALHHHFGTLEPDPFAYLQVKYVNLGEPAEPQLVQGSF